MTFDTKMPLRSFGFGLALAVALAGPALAYDRSGTIHFDSRLGAGTSTFSEAFDPAAGTFSRTGKITLDSGRTVTYAFSANCPHGPASCSFTGSATGPFGGKWQVQGTSERNGDGRHVVGNLTGPDGRTIAFDRQLKRGGFFLKGILRSGDEAK
ncbi:MAG TPA: hypothetical protein VN106_05260 [Sphingomicrobium sp.]|jgi:hypothetical protein|nr:hypothetical protein [Sphingomicrobium sp.]